MAASEETGAVFFSRDGRWKLEWVDLGEGLAGDYRPEEPGDVPLLRADLSCSDPATWDDGTECGSERWGTPRDASYCTLAPVGSSQAALREGAEALFSALGGAAQPKRLMEAWSWRVYPGSPGIGREA